MISGIHRPATATGQGLNGYELYLPWPMGIILGYQITCQKFDESYRGGIRPMESQESKPVLSVCNREPNSPKF